MTKRNTIILITAIILLDQILKFYIKLNYAAGDEKLVIGNWFRLHFVENEGMAWGWKFGGEFGKIVLTLFRLGAVIWGCFIIKDFIEKNYHKWFIVCAALIFAGALGNLIDSLFYGMIFDTTFNPQNFQNAGVIANVFEGKGYGSFLHGKVVDMLYFPLFDGKFPTWFPVWGGEQYLFFSPVFNIADASITLGVICIFIFQNIFFKKVDETVNNTIETKLVVDDNSQVM